MICKACGTVNDTARRARGSGWIELVLWLTFIIPIALIYSIWRRAGVRPSCSACGGQDLVGLQTPVGRRLAAEYHPGGLPPPSTVAAAGASVNIGSALRVAGALAALLVGTLVVAAVFGQIAN